MGRNCQKRPWKRPVLRWAAAINETLEPKRRTFQDDLENELGRSNILPSNSVQEINRNTEVAILCMLGQQIIWKSFSSQETHWKQGGSSIDFLLARVLAPKLADTFD